MLRLKQLFLADKKIVTLTCRLLVSHSRLRVAVTILGGTAGMALKISSKQSEKYSLRIHAIIHFAIFSVIRTVSTQECFDDGNEFCIDQDDILSVDLLPGSFLFNDQNQNDSVSKSTENETIDGSFDKALNEMDYHR